MNPIEPIQLLRQVLESKGIRHELLPNRESVGFMIESEGAPVSFMARTERELLLCAGQYRMPVGENRLSEVAEAASRINRLQMRGTFILDFAEGRVQSRYAHWIGRRPPLREEWEEVLDVTVLGMFTWYPVFARILQSDDSVAELVQERVEALAADAP